jgi:superfamily II DNA/RNA helicase
VQNADNSSLFDDLDAALQRGSSEKRAAMLRQVTDLLLSEADRLNEEQIGVFDDVMVQLIERIQTRTMAEISARLAPAAKALVDLALNRARHSGARLSENNLAALLRGRKASARSA